MKTNEVRKAESIHRTVMMLVMLFTLIGGFASAQTNMIANPGFETSGAASWTETVTGTTPADGTGAGEYHGGAIGRTYWMPGSATIALKQTFSSPTAGTYSASVWTRRENYTTAGGGDYYRLRVMNGATQLASVSFPYGGTYAQSTLTGITVPSAATLIFIVEVLAQNGNCYITVDDASLTLTSGGTTVATPTLSPVAGTYSSSQSVSLSCATSGASIYYTTDNTTPTTSSTLYNGTPISVANSKTLKVFATKSAMTSSAVASAIYIINPASPTNYYVSTTGSDGTGTGLSGSPWKTIAYAADHVAGGGGHTINVGAGTFSESFPIMLNPKVNLDGAGQASTTITKSGTFDLSNTDYNVPAGSLIQLVSSPLPSAPTDGLNQVLSDFKVDGSSRTVKAGVWVQNRKNVTMTNVTITNTNFRGAVFSPGYKDWYIEPAYYLTGINVNNCTFTNTSKDVSGQSLGALNISGLDGANIYNITISEDQGYGIKFIYDGYFKNTQIHDCNISVQETDPNWGEDISIEFWNAGANNQIYNITCNTWLSLVNHLGGPFNSATSAGQRLKVYGIKMIDGNASSGKEAIEAAVPGLEIYDSYFQNKGFGVAAWDCGGRFLTVRNCTFYNSTSQVGSWGATGALYIDNSSSNQYNNINIYNNIFDAQSNAVNLKNTGGGITDVNIKNNAFLNGTNADVITSGSSISNIVFTNNLKGSGSWSLTGVTTNSNNVVGAPGYANTGNRYDATYYAPTAACFALAKGVNVGLPYTGTAPEAGRYEWAGSGGREITSPVVAEESSESMITSYPNPTSGMIRITSAADSKIEGVQVMNLQGKTVISKSVTQLNSTDIDLSQQPNDIYIFRIKHQKGMMTKKVVLMK